MTVEIIKPESQEIWLSLRAQDITSTEASALFGLSPYATKFELWHRKREKTVLALEENVRMKWGTRLQDAIAGGIAEDNGWLLRRMDEYARLPDERLGASFDFRIRQKMAVADEMVEGGVFVDTPEDELLEIKNVDSLIFKDKWVVDDEDGSIEAPPHIEVQVQHQLLVSGLKHANIGALIGGNKVVLIKRERDEKIIAAIRQKSAEFWQSIEQGIPPAPDFVRDAEFIASLYGYAEVGKVLDASANHSVRQLVASYKDAQAKEKDAANQKEAFKAALLMQIGDAEKVIGEGWSISAGMIAGGHIEYERKPYRNFRVNTSKKKAQEVA